MELILETQCTNNWSCGQSYRFVQRKIHGEKVTYLLQCTKCTEIKEISTRNDTGLVQGESDDAYTQIRKDYIDQTILSLLAGLTPNKKDRASFRERGCQ